MSEEIRIHLLFWFSLAKYLSLPYNNQTLSNIPSYITYKIYIQYDILFNYLKLT